MRQQTRSHGKNDRNMTQMRVCVCVCVCVCVYVCVSSVCVCACVCARARARARVCVCHYVQFQNFKAAFERKEMHKINVAEDQPILLVHK